MSLEHPLGLRDQDSEEKPQTETTGSSKVGKRIHDAAKAAVFVGALAGATMADKPAEAKDFVFQGQTINEHIAAKMMEDMGPHFQYYYDKGMKMENEVERKDQMIFTVDAMTRHFMDLETTKVGENELRFGHAGNTTEESVILLQSAMKLREIYQKIIDMYGTDSDGLNGRPYRLTSGGLYGDYYARCSIHVFDDYINYLKNRVNE